MKATSWKGYASNPIFHFKLTSSALRATPFQLKKYWVQMVSLSL